MTISKATELARAGKYPSNRLGQRERKTLEVAEQIASPDANLGSIDTQDEAINALAATVGPMTGETGSLQRVKARYSFATHTGAQGTISLGVALPNKAVVKSVVTDVISAPTGDTATMKLVLPTDGDLTTAQTVGSFDTKSEVLAQKCTAARNLSVTIATADITAGIVDYYVEYYIGA